MIYPKTSYEFIKEHLYDVALRGGYQEELAQVKEHLPALAGFAGAVDLIRTTRRNRKLRHAITGQLRQLWKSNYALRPASGAILMLVLRPDAPAAGQNYWYRLFVYLAEDKGGVL